MERGNSPSPDSFHSGERGHPLLTLHLLGAFGVSILAPAALDLAPRLQILDLLLNVQQWQAIIIIRPFL